MALNVKPTLILFKPECVKESSLRKQPAFGDATNWFPREMTSEKRAQKFHGDDASLPETGRCF